MLDTRTPQQHSKENSFSMCVALRGNNVALPILSNNAMHTFSPKKAYFSAPRALRARGAFLLFMQFIHQTDK
jgi:hypothetical protein